MGARCFFSPGLFLRHGDCATSSVLSNAPPSDALSLVSHSRYGCASHCLLPAARVAADPQRLGCDLSAPVDSCSLCLVTLLISALGPLCFTVERLVLTLWRSDPARPERSRACPFAPLLPRRHVEAVARSPASPSECLLLSLRPPPPPRSEGRLLPRHREGGFSLLCPSERLLLSFGRPLREEGFRLMCPSDLVL